ncbi:MAG TPA: DUF427 domain-containing protein [Euzebyales bacterium]|nr:DUF427 domain-containing protein [Euzebyales bacterium]
MARRIVCAGRTVVDTTDAVRVLETSHPPTWYMPVAALRGAHLAMTACSTWCEFNGRASYGDIVGPDRTVLAPWCRVVVSATGPGVSSNLTDGALSIRIGWTGA